jgi:hypothetical protein
VGGLRPPSPVGAKCSSRPPRDCQATRFGPVSLGVFSAPCPGSPSRTSTTRSTSSASDRLYALKRARARSPSATPLTCSSPPGTSPTWALTSKVRDPACFELLAEIVGCFDLVAVEEVRDDVDAGIRKVLAQLPDSWQLIFSETGGNDERMAFLWDAKVVELGQMVGKVTFEPNELEAAGGAGFLGFSRTPLHRDLPSQQASPDAGRRSQLLRQGE